MKLEKRMNHKSMLLAISLLSLAACGSDDSPTIEELEAAQAGVELVDEKELGALDRVPLTKEVAKGICGFQLSQTIGGNPDSSEVKNVCACIVGGVPLSEIIEANEAERSEGIPPINRRGVLEVNVTITEQCLGG